MKYKSPSGFHLLCGKPVLFMGFSGLHYIHNPQSLLGVDSLNCLHWNNRPCKTEHAKNLRFTTHLPRLRVSASEARVTAGTSPPTFLRMLRRGSQGQNQEGEFGKRPSAVPVRFNFTQYCSHQ